jgi:hypothetical protein
MKEISNEIFDSLITQWKQIHASENELFNFYKKPMDIVDRVRIRSHLRGCEKCSAEYELLIQTLSEKKSLWIRLIEIIQGATEAVTQPVRGTSRWASPIAIAVIVCAILGAVYWRIPASQHRGSGGDDSQYAQSNATNQNAGQEKASPYKEPDTSQPEETNQQNPIAKTDLGTGMLSPPNAPSIEPSSAKPSTAQADAGKRSTSRDRRQTALNQSKKALQIQMAKSFRDQGATEDAGRINAGELEVGVEENKGPGSFDFTLYKIKKGGKREVVFNKGVRDSSLAAACDQFAKSYLAER